MKEPGRSAIGTWSGGRFLHYGEAIEADRLAALLRPGEGIDTVLTADAYGTGEAGRVLGEHVMTANPTTDARIIDAFRRVCSRRPDADELRILTRSLYRALKVFQADPSQAKLYLHQGATPPNPKLDPAEDAAYASVCLAILNLDEALTRE